MLREVLRKQSVMVKDIFFGKHQLIIQFYFIIWKRNWNLEIHRKIGFITRKYHLHFLRFYIYWIYDIIYFNFWFFGDIIGLSDELLLFFLIGWSSVETRCIFSHRNQQIFFLFKFISYWQLKLTCSTAYHLRVLILFFTLFSATFVVIPFFFKGCVRYIFTSLFCMSKREDLQNKEKCFLFQFESSSRSWDNQILNFDIFKCHDVIKYLSMKHETHFIE